ncbi:hypothetical protein [Flavobacterium sp. UGB4466]|uniref:hypothetical protein n=1 Tax=Flavobacterium sp. UGB4466 TaxID=2730889 RepID=UPI00192BFDCB|nr:hypothetical protein [Flavobacterium sp. UGB4466]
MKEKLFVLLIMICVTIMYPQTNKDKYEAINTYLSLIVKDTTKTIVVVKEKMSSNGALKLFSGGKLNDVPFSRVNGIEERLGGILEPLYDETDFQKMRKKYQDDTNEGKYELAKNANWSAKDFKLKNIYLEAFDTIMYKKGKELFDYKYHAQLIILSEPMYYKDKKHLVIAIAIGDTSPLGYFDDHVVVMKKINNRWQVIKIGEKYWVE